MKKSLFVLTLVMLLAISAMAQDPVKGLTGAGFKAGVVMAKATGDNIDLIADENNVDIKNLMGFAVGGFIEYSFSPSFAIQPEILYNTKGVKFEQGDVTDKVTMTYMQIPVLLKFNIPTAGNFDPFIYAGPSVGILLSAKDKLEGTDDDYDEDIKDSFKSTDFTAVLGLGAGIPMGTSGQLTFEFRYDMGLTNVAEDMVVDTETFEGDVKTQNMGIFIGFSFL